MACLTAADTNQALSVLRTEEAVARRIEALRDLEAASDLLRDPELRAQVAALEAGAPEALARALGAALHRARLQDQVRASSPGGSSMKAELAQQILLDGSADERLRFLEGALDAEAVETLPALIDHLERESDPRVRTLVAKAVGAFGSSVDVEAFKSATRDPETEVRIGAVRGLLYQRHKQALRLLLERLTDSEKGVRDATVEVLASFPMDEIVGTLAGLPEGKGSKLKRGAVRVLRLYPDHPGAAKLLRRYLDSSSALLAAEALVALAAQGDDVALARILELDGRCDAKMQRVLDMAKEAYGAFSEAAVDEFHEETSVVSGVVSMPPLEQAAAPARRAIAEEDDEDDDSGDWEVERPPQRLSTAPDELPASEGVGSDLDSGVVSSVSDTVVEPSHPDIPPVDILATQETMIGPADGPAPPPAAAEPENPWDSIAGPAAAVAAAEQIREEPPAPASAPPAPAADASHEEPTFPIPDGDTPPPARPAPDPVEPTPPPPPQPAPKGWRLAILGALLVGVGGTGWMAYQAGQAQAQVDAQSEELRVEMNRLLQAVRNAEAGKGTPLRADGLEAVAAEALGEDARDPWGNAYRYDPVLRRLISTGPDGLPDGAARYGDTSMAPDDEFRLLDAPPPPLGVSFASATGFVLAALRPGETQVRTFTLGPGEAAPIRPAFTQTMSRVAYLLEASDGAGFEAFFRRRQAGQAVAWDPPEALLPPGWTASELTWARGGEIVLAVAKDRQGTEGLYGVEPGSSPILLSDKLQDATNVRVHPDGKHFLLSAVRPTTTSLDGIRQVVLGMLTGEDLSPGGARFKWGPRGHTGLFTEDRGRILVVGPDPDQASDEALIEYLPANEDQPATSRKLIGGVPHLTCAVMSQDGTMLAYCEGRNVVVMRLSTLEQALVFVVPAAPSAIVWPVPVSL